MRAGEHHRYCKANLQCSVSLISHGLRRASCPYPFCPFGTFPPVRGNRPLGEAKLGLCEYVQFSKFRWNLLLTAPIQRQHITNLIPTTAGGAYQSARIVTECECRSYQISFPPELHCGTDPASPQHSFLPCLFSCERKDRAVGDTSPFSKQ